MKEPKTCNGKSGRFKLRKGAYSRLMSFVKKHGDIVLLHTPSMNIFDDGDFEGGIDRWIMGSGNNHTNKRGRLINSRGSVVD